MQNITQTVKFPVSSIILSPVTDDLRVLMMKAREAKQAYDAMPSETPADVTTPGPLKDLWDAYVKARGELDAATSDKLKTELEHFGATALSDDVNVNMQLGTAMFDIYSRLTPEPQAPLAKLIWRKKSMELAEVFDANEFTIPDYAMGAIRRALLDESVWSSLSLSAWVDLVPGDGGAIRRQYFSVSPKGVRYFHKILEAAAEMVYTEELKDAK